MNIWIIWQQILVLRDIGDCDEEGHVYKVSAILHRLEHIVSRV